MADSGADTDELVTRAGGGDASALSSLFRRHRSRLVRMIEARMHPGLRARVDSSDVIQETFTAASQKMKDYAAQRPIAFYPWLRQIAWEKLVHLHDRHLRAAKRSVAREQFLDIADESAIALAKRLVGTMSSPSTAAIRQEMLQRVRRAFNQLPPGDGEVLVQRYLEQMSSKEIADVLGVSEAAVNMRHMRALERIRNLLASDR